MNQTLGRAQTPDACEVWSELLNSPVGEPSVSTKPRFAANTSDIKLFGAGSFDRGSIGNRLPVECRLSGRMGHNANRPDLVAVRGLAGSDLEPAHATVVLDRRPFVML